MYTVLIIGNDPVIVDINGYLLKSTGLPIEVERVQNFSELFNQVKNKKYSFLLISYELPMDDFDGISLYKCLQSKLQACPPAILCSFSDTSFLSKKAVDAGFDDCIDMNSYITPTFQDILCGKIVYLLNKDNL